MSTSLNKVRILKYRISDSGDEEQLLHETLEDYNEGIQRTYSHVEKPKCTESQLFALHSSVADIRASLIENMNRREYLGLGYAPGDNENPYHMIRGDSGPNEIYFLTE